MARSRCVLCGRREIDPPSEFKSCVACSYPPERVRVYATRGRGRNQLSHANDAHRVNRAKSHRSVQMMLAWRRENQTVYESY
jgi:ribosomal protein L37E